MSNTFVRVAAPSRLHFGMFSFGQPDVPAFGGVGVMIDLPGLVLEIHASDEFRCWGPLAGRARKFALRATENWGMRDEPPCEIRVMSGSPQHVGLGTGTQLAMSVAAGLKCFLGETKFDAVELARSVGRGQRSAVGSHGFLQGGLIVDPGRLVDNRSTATESEMPARIEHVVLPTEWRFVLIQLGGHSGRHGPAEELAFAQLPRVPKGVTGRLRAIVDNEMLPAAGASDFERFGEAVHEFGHLAGTCFATQQTGPFANEEIAQMVARLRANGCRGVGQSSWGPTVFALAADETEAERIVEDMWRRYSHEKITIRVTAASEHGAMIQREQ